MPTLGFKIDARPADDIVGLARAIEGAGFDEMWVCEDLGLAGGIAQVSAAVAVTDRLRVGLGIAPAAVRNPMYLAMELAAVQRISHGRFYAGIGHGMPDWLRQVGAHPGSLMARLREVTEPVRDLLDGRGVTYHGAQVRLDDVSLTHPPEPAPQLSLGVRGPQGIQLARDLGIGVILAEGSTPGYVADVRNTLGPAARITVFVWTNLNPDDRDGARSALLPQVTAALQKGYLAAQLGDLSGTSDGVAAVEELTVSGDVASCRAAVDRLTEAGADTVVLQPLLGHEEQQIALLGRHLTG